MAQNINKFITKLLKLSFLKVRWYGFKDRGKELHLGVKPYKNGSCCPICGRKGQTLKLLEKRVWRDIVVCGIPVFFIINRKKIVCQTHGRIMENIPWSASHSRITYRLELNIVIMAKGMTQKAVSKLLKLPTSTLSDIIHRVITREREGHKIRGLKVIGVDEISYVKGKKYITLVYDLERSQVVWVGKGKGKETIDWFFQNKLSKGQRDRISHACCDMSKAYISSIKENCPKAILVLDKFHIIQALIRPLMR